MTLVGLEAFESPNESIMRPDVQKIEDTVLPLLSVHGTELVALEWFQGTGGRGLLRISVDQPDGDPRIKDPTRSVALDAVTRITRDISAALDALDLIPVAYTLEVGSPGLERPLQKQKDYDRFKGLVAHLEVRPALEGRLRFNGTLEGTINREPDGFAVRISCDGQTFEVPRARIVRAYLHEIKDDPKPRKAPGKANKAAR